MRGESGQRPRYICRSCWSARQRRYSENKAPEVARAEKNASRAKRQTSWSDERKELERRRRYNAWLIRNYGISIEQFDQLYQEQGGRCRICETSKPRGRGGFHVDHCHKSNVVRGLLCAECNMMLGLAKDKKETLMKAISYLETDGRLGDHGAITTQACSSR